MAKVFQVDTGGTLNTSLVSYYKLEDATNYFGSSPLTNTNSVAFNAGKVGNAADTGVSNTNKSLDISTGWGINGGTMSMAFWVNFTTLPGSAKTLVGQSPNSSGNVGYRVDYDGTTLIANRYKNGVGDQTATETVSLSTGTWYHVVITYDNTNVKLYRNNALKNTTAASGSGTGSLSYGSNLFNVAGIQYMSGLLDELGVWSKALSTQEISDLYNGGAGQTMVVSVPATGATLLTALAF